MREEKGCLHHIARMFLVLLATFVMAVPSYAYPPKTQDWQALDSNNSRFLMAWDSFVVQFQDGDATDLKSLQATMSAQMGEVNSACAAIRDQIGSGGLFGPEMWTKGFAHTCWALASFQKAGAHDLAAKVCGETKDAINFFTAFRPKKWPADYAAAQDHIGRFTKVNNDLREILTAAGAKGCKPVT